MALTKPHSDQAERAVLGAALIDDKQIGLFTSVLQEEDFYNDNYKKIYNAICALTNNNVKVDVTSVSDYLANAGQLEEVGGLSELIELTDSVVSSNIFSYINIIQEKTNLRNLAVLLDNTVDNFDKDSLENTDQYLNDFEKAVIKITRNKHYEQFKKTSDLINSFQSSLQNPEKNENGLPTGYSILDYKLNGGWQKGDLIVVGARTGVGKTAIALNFALNAAKRQNTPVLFFSLEMDAERLVGRLISMAGNIDGKKVNMHNIKGREDLIRVEQACKTLHDLPIYFDDTAMISLIDLEKKARLFQQRLPELGLIIVDYMQIISVASSKGQSREHEVAKISVALKGLARDLNVPVIALAQLNRAATGGAEFKKKTTEIKEPEITELRESGQIEQDADVILLLHREGAYSHENDDKPQPAKLLLKKNRNGEPGEIKLVFTPQFQKFDNINGE